MMNDRFKFRVYIPDKKYSKNTLIGMFKVHSLHTGTNKAIISSLYGNVSIKLENNILMQCTGLKDKNGKLIYEGDIVKIKNKIFFIKYEIGSFLIIRNEQSLDAWYEMFTEAWNDDVYPLSQLYVDEYIQEECIDCIEVIGNIYENSTLLEGETNVE